MAWLSWRFLKFCALALFASGLWSACSAKDQRSRLSAAHWTVSAGLVASWIAGYALMKATGRSFTPWIVQAMAASLVASTGALVAAARPKATALGVGLALAGFAAATTTMIGRGTVGPAWQLGLPLALGVAGGVTALRLDPPTPEPEHAAHHLRWFTWVARLEGASLVFMVGISMPLKMLASISLDGGQGWIGWVHGIFVLVYLQALVAVAASNRWPWSRALGAFVASLLPFGTLVFERRVLSATVDERQPEAS